MGYQTEFTGHVTVTPPLNGPEMAFLRQFAGSRRYQCTDGPFHVTTAGDPNRHSGCRILDTNMPPVGQPGLWCKWEATEDGLGIEWNGVEKFYDAAEWMTYLIDTFLKPSAVLATELVLPVEGRFYDPAFQHFTFNHVVSGRIEAQGEDPDDRWTLAVTDNVVEVVKYPTLAERMDTDAAIRAAFETLRAAGVTPEQYEAAVERLGD